MIDTSVVNRSPYYKLDEAGDPVACEDLLDWAAWFAVSHEERVFLSIDHGFHDGDPVLWETLMFGGEYDLACDRYRSREDALVGHEVWVLVAKGEMTPIDARRLRSRSAPTTAEDREKKRNERS
jgi:hypothetical protein